MKASNSLWKERLTGQISAPLSKELDIFENEVLLRKQGKIEERVFAETRLRRGAYGQRYDNGQRHDGKIRPAARIPYAGTKGPNTLWDAPGMQRIKIPFGGLNARQLEILADLARNTRTASPTSPRARISSFISSTSKTRRHLCAVSPR